MTYARQTQRRPRLAVVPKRPAPNMGEINWSGFGDWATGIYGQYSQTQIAEGQSETALATAQTELEQLKLQREMAQDQAAIAELDAAIRTKQLEIASKFLVVVVPVLLIGGGILYYVTRPKKGNRKRR